MKRVRAVGVSLVLGLWAGYSLGYHHGTRQEQSAWLASEEVRFNPSDGQLNTVCGALVSTPRGAAQARRAVQAPELHRLLRQSALWEDPYRHCRPCREHSRPPQHAAQLKLA